MHFTQEQREAWQAETSNSPFNHWLRTRTIGADGRLDLRLLREVATEFGIDATKYAHLNPGRQRMNVGNRLRKNVPAEIYSAAEVAPERLINKIAVAASAYPVMMTDVDWPSIKTASASTLLRFQASAIEELRLREIVRTGNAPLGDYAEYLCSRAFGWKLASNSAASFDAEDSCGLLYQIKARRLRSDATGERQLGVMRGLPDCRFNYLAAVLFARDFSIFRAALIPHATVLARSTHVKHVNGWRFNLDDGIWRLEGVKDITAQIQAAAGMIDQTG